MSGHSESAKNIPTWTNSGPFNVNNYTDVAKSLPVNIPCESSLIKSYTAVKSYRFQWICSLGLPPKAAHSQISVPLVQHSNQFGPLSLLRDLMTRQLQNSLIHATVAKIWSLLFPTSGTKCLLPLWRAIWSGRFQEGLFSCDFVDEISYFHSVHLWEEPNKGGGGGVRRLYMVEINVQKLITKHSCYKR